MKNRIINKKNILIFIISLFIALLFELLFFQIYSIIGKNTYKKITPSKLVNVEKNGEYYVTKSNKSKIVFNTNNAYINELSFFYISDNDFQYNIIIIDKNGETNIYTNSSSSIIHLSNKKVHNNAKKVILEFNNKNIKIKDFAINNKIDFNSIRFLYIFIGSILFGFIIFNSQLVLKRLDLTFLVVSILLGTLIILVTPFSAFTSNDDQVHFHNAYTLLDGKYTCWNDSERYYDKLLLYAPSRFKTQEETSKYIDFLNKNSKCINKVNINHNISYNNLIYLPQAIIMKICKLLNTPFVFTLFMGKFINLLIFSIFISFSIKIIPFCKKSIFIIGLLPTVLYLATQFSYDPPITGACILALSFYLKMLNDKKVKSFDFVCFMLLLMWACLPKAIYCPLYLLPIFIKKDKFDNKKDKKKVVFISLLFFIIFLSTFVLPSILGEVSGDARIANTSASGQLKYIMSNPINYIKILLFYTVDNFYNYLFGFETFSAMGYVINTEFSFIKIFVFISLILVFWSIFTDKCPKEIITNKLKIIYFIILTIIWCLVATALYLSWTPVGSPTILGVQGRYFIPVLILFHIILKPTYSIKEKLNNNDNVLFIILPILVLLFDILLLLLIYHW